MCERYEVDVIAIGNGTGHRLAQLVCDDMMPNLPPHVCTTLVSEAGASVYSVSTLAEEEYPRE
jgi:protein Tex